MGINIVQVTNLIRKNIKELTPYSSARDEFVSAADVYLDANENPFNWEYNRYPDPYQLELKGAISRWRNINTENIFAGNGSDEIIDLIIRIFCVPGKDHIIAMNPSYGMYKVCADIHDVDIKYIELDEAFHLPSKLAYSRFSNKAKVIFLCSPNNPSGNCISIADVTAICSHFEGVVVLDEAYIDFAQTPSCISLLSEFPNLIILQTLSKAIGCAGLRLGIGFMHPALVAVLNKIKHPYNISTVNQQMAIKRLADTERIENEIVMIRTELQRMEKALLKFRMVEKIFPSEANFLLVRCKNHEELYHFLWSNGIVVRNRGGQFRCERCLRITIGTPTENDNLLKVLDLYTHKF
jgi:histidinol-phosphate aminotransferase